MLNCKIHSKLEHIKGLSKTIAFDDKTLKIDSDIS